MGQNDQTPVPRTHAGIGWVLPSGHLQSPLFTTYVDNIMAQMGKIIKGSEYIFIPTHI